MMNLPDTLLHTIEGDGIHVITFNRPDALNALNLETMSAFRELVQSLAAADDLRVVIVTGAGERAFCSGGDLNQLANYPTEADALHFITIMGDALLDLERLPVPVIAAVNGYALGGGSEIALACDMRVVDARVKMGMVQINMAVTPGWGAGQRLLRVVGYARAMEILLRGEVMRADQLNRLHLVNDVVAAGQALPAALEFARAIADRPPNVVKAIKALLQAGLQSDYAAALDAERALFPPLWADQPHLDAVAAFQARQNAKRDEGESA